MFLQCFLSTSETTVQFDNNGACFVITGDIPAMWLRDSSAQVNHYVRFVDKCPEAYRLILGLLRRQCQCILADPYANAFNKEANGSGHQEDRTEQKAIVWERKYEIDSLCYPVRLAYLFWRKSGTVEHFTSEFHSALNAIVDLWIVEQHHETSPYYFERHNCPSSDTLPNMGLGTPVKYTGMTWSGFRPSDDACQYGFLIPANMFAAVILSYICEIAEVIYKDNLLFSRAEKLQNEINEGIRKYGIVHTSDGSAIYAYEVDGFGHRNLMDDANVPSLLSLPYLGYCSESDLIYQNTRSFVLSERNPFFFSGTEAQGIGSPHTPHNHIWPIALCMQGLTSNNLSEIAGLIQVLSSTDGGTGFMHESFHKDDSKSFTRPWFSWANSLFAELVMKYIDMEGRL